MSVLAKKWLAVCFGLMAASSMAITGNASPLVIQDVRLFDGEKASDHRTVVVNNGVIDQIGAAGLHVSGAEIVDGRGRTLLPGLFDAHLHLPVPDPLPAMHQAAIFGVTTVLDMFNGRIISKLREIEAQDPPNVADVRGAGFGAVAPQSVMEKISNNRIPPISGPEDAQAWVDARIAEGSDFIKIIYDPRQGGPVTQATVKAIVDAAHKRDRLVVAHVLSEQRAREAIAAGVDGLAHLFLGDEAGKDFGQYAAEHHIFVIPTLTVLYTLCGKPQARIVASDPVLGPELSDAERKQLLAFSFPRVLGRCDATTQAIHELVEAQVPILAGTDTGPAITGPPDGAGYGAFLQRELQLLVENGMTPSQALIAATSAPARAFRITDRGTIRPGMRADLLLVQGDPTKDISATRNVVAVWKKGVRVKP